MFIFIPALQIKNGRELDESLMKASLARTAGWYLRRDGTDRIMGLQRLCTYPSSIPDACACGQRPKGDTGCPGLPLPILLL